MPEEPDLNMLPKATVGRSKRLRISVVWIIPILAAVVAIGIAIQRITNEGPTITVVFKAAQGIQAGKTFLKYKEVTIGEVSAVDLSEDYTKVVVKAKIAKHAAGLMVEDTKLWVVTPRITLSGVSGLGTLLSGNYIEVQRGKSASRRYSFVGLDVPSTVPDRHGRQFVLKASSLGSVGVGAPLYYRSLAVGQVLGYTLGGDGKSIEITVFVDAPYDQYVTSVTRFWNASGVDVSTGEDGLDVHMESLAALLAGGIAFETPDFLPSAEPAAANTSFTLYPNQSLAMKQPYSLERRYVLHFNESVRGLPIGAPVTLMGVTVGQVTDVGLSLDAARLVLRPRVFITYFPEKVVARLSTMEQVGAGKILMDQSTEGRLRLWRRLFEEQGLSAELKTGSLLTGAQYVDFEFHPHAPKPTLNWGADPIELPVASGGFASVVAKLNSILEKVDRMPLEAIGVEAKDLLATTNKTLQEADRLITRANTELLPEASKTLEVMHRAIADADQALLGKDASAPQDLHDALQEMASAARAARVLMDYLERHPEALIRGKKEEKP
jgi:paraquat-inducible protein B